MFASKFTVEKVIRGLLIAIFFFNAFVPTAVIAQENSALTETVDKPAVHAGRSNYKNPVFTHPTARQGEASSAIENSTMQVIEDADWLCVDDPNGWYEDYTGCPSPNLPVSPYTASGSFDGGYPAGFPVISRAKIDCSPKPGCIAGKVVYFRVSANYSWTSMAVYGSIHHEVRFRVISTGNISSKTSEYVDCGTGTSGSCTLFFEGAITLPNYPWSWDVTTAIEGTTSSSTIMPDRLVDYQVEYSLLPPVYSNSVLTGCNISGDCEQGAASNTQGVWGKPINTRTGGLFYQIEDINIPTVSKELNFFRSYSSLATDLYSSTLGYGWAHNLDTRLIFSEDPGGEAGYVLFKAHTANLYRFTDDGNGNFAPTPGAVGDLVEDNDEYIVTYPNQVVYTFDSSGKLITWTDALGNEWEYSYDENDLLEQVSAHEGSRFLALAYDEEDRIVAVTDHEDRSIEYTYDENGDLVSATSLGGGTWEYEYDAEHRLTRVIDPNGNTDEETEYDEEGRAIRQWDGEGNLMGELTYNTDGTTTITDSLENVETHTYSNRLTLASDEDGAGGTTNKTYDENFRPTTIMDAAEDITTLTWSEDGANLTRILDAEGGQTDITYNAFNLPTSVIDPREYLTTYEYDGTLLTSVTNALDQETTYTYTTEGFLESVTDALENTTSYTYDSNGQVISMTDALENTWGYEYDDLGRLTDITNPLGRITHNEYDAAGRLVFSVQNYDLGKDQNEDNTWNIATEYEYDFAGNQIAVTDTLGRTTQYAYDDADRLIKVIDPDANETTYTYNEAGQLVIATDALGRETHFEYDEAGRLIETTDDLGNTTTTTYNPDGTVASTTDTLERVASYEYDSLKRVVTVIFPDSSEAHNTYDEAGNLISTMDGLGNETTYGYDALNRVIKTIDPLLGETENFYDDAGNLIQTIDARGNATTYEYDELNRMVKVIDDLGNETEYEYDEIGRRSAVINAEDGRTEYTYDELSRVVAVNDSLENTSFTEYDALGQVISQTDANGNITTFEYDDLGRLHLQTDMLDHVTRLEYDAVGNQVYFVDPRDSITETVFDALNRPVEVIDPVGNHSFTAYDAAGQVISVTDAMGHATVYEYDEMGRQVSVTDPTENVSWFEYDDAGRMTGKVDANEIVTHYEYDDLGRLTAVVENFQGAAQPTEEINVRTEYTYDENGNRLSITDGNGNVSNFTYDELNRLLTESDALGNTWSYTYDALGNRIALTDANGAITSYNYDDASRLTGIDYMDISDVAFAYDAGGRRTSMTDSVGTTTWTYDELNRPYEITDPFDSLVRYHYDASGNRERMVYPGLDVGYEYDSANRLTTVFDFSKNTHYEYDPTGRLERIFRPNGVDTIYTYNPAGRVVQLEHRTVESQLALYQYTYNDVGNRTQAVERFQTVGAGPTIRLTVVNNGTALEYGREVHVFSGETELTEYQTVTDANGQALITLPEGSYRFRVDIDGVEFWSGPSTGSGQAPEDHCTIGECRDVIMTVPIPVRLDVWDGEAFVPDMEVFAYENGEYTGYHGTTEADGGFLIRLPEGEYFFRTEYNGTDFWSAYACPVPGCWGATINVNQPITVNVLDNLNMPQEGVEVIAFDGETETQYSGVTDENGQVHLTLPTEDYRFRAEFNGGYYWSGTADHCAVPECNEATIDVILPVVVTVLDTDETPQQDVTVYAYDGATDTGLSAVTDADGRAFIANLPVGGDYRFKAVLNGTDFWSNTQDHCTIPECTGAQVTVTIPVTVTVTNLLGAPVSGVPVRAFDGLTDTGYNAITNASGQALLTLPAGSYRFEAQYNSVPYWSGLVNHCTIPSCTSASITVGSLGYQPSPLRGSGRLLIRGPRPALDPPNDLTVTVLNTDDEPQENLTVYAFDGETYTGFSGMTDSNGVVLLTLPDGNYRFSTDLNGTIFWSDATNHCNIPGCNTAEIVVTIPMIVTVVDTNDAPQEGLEVQVFDGETFTGFAGTTDSSGEVTFTLPAGNYRFRAIRNGTIFWSDDENHCTIPGCTLAEVIATIPITVTVQDTDETPKEGVDVSVFDGETDTGYSGVTDSNGEVQFTLPEGAYRFRADLNGVQFWSDDVNHCAIPGCEADENLITVTKPVIVTVLDENEDPYIDFEVYAFDGEAPTGYHARTDANGQASVTLPAGNYRFAADIRGTLFWSDDENHCEVPGCESASTAIPGGYEYEEVTIDYSYDSLYRLTDANYSTGDYYSYTYDAVGNRLSEDKVVFGLSPIETDYTYDDANRLTEMNSVPYSWDDNGNLLDDGVNEYTYDSANRMTGMTNGENAYTFAYNGFGDRLQQTVNEQTTNYTLDLNSGLTQVLWDGTHFYTYGLGRVSQLELGGNTPEYFLTDALGSVRQLTHESSSIVASKSYDPYGNVLSSTEGVDSVYGYTGEQTDPSGMVYLRARYYAPYLNQFIQPDTIVPDPRIPADWNKYAYVRNNPINYTDPSGYSPACDNGDWDRCGIPDWWKRRSHLYVEGYGYFDTGHLQRGWGSAKWIEESIDALVGGGEIHLSSKEGQPPKEIYWVDYGVTANIKTLDKAQKISIMYGIYTDFERGYENYQLHRVDRFPSAFSPEDLPSDHLGFWAYTHGLTEDDIPFLLECLGEVTDRGSDQFASVVVDYVSGPYGRASWYPRNFKFQPMITETYSSSYGGSESISRNISWPTWLQIQPIPSGPNTWWRVRDGHK
jgi:RHS repeat-associated protein